MKTSLRAETGAKLSVLLSMAIWGSVGIFVRYIPLPSSVIALARGVIGLAFLLLVVLLRAQRVDFAAIRRNLPVLCISSVALGANWILLFEAYRFTTVATATLCYYFAPILLIVASPILLKEKLSRRKVLCVVVALVGMVFVSGVAEGGLPGRDEALGIAFGLLAAVLYATVVLMNKKMRDIAAFDRTMTQLGLSAVVLLPYILLTENLSTLQVDAMGIALLAVVGVVHTGIAYALYFGALDRLKAQTAAIFSYVDPVLAIVFSALLLREPLTIYSVIGAVLILGSALVSELPERKRSDSTGR
ncbi:MAG: DMT family transporter [Ruminococcaceae bacterium]|nr:DMT family transporter [Oscillospiraceae bacterium]